MTKVTQAFIFAAGRGDRMRPFTDGTPKPLALVGKKPILGHILDKVSKIGSIQNIVINGHYLASQIENYILGFKNPKIKFSYEEEKLETGGGLVFALQSQKFDQNKPILLINGDILFKEQGEVNEIENLSNFYQNNDCDIALGLVKTDDLFGYVGSGDFDLSQNGDLSKNSQKNSHVFTGLAIINPRILKLASEKSFSMGYFYNNFQDLGLKICGAELSSQFFHIGDMESLNDCQNLL